MELIILSIIFCFIGLFAGAKLDFFEGFPYVLGVIGFFSPSLYMLDKLYNEFQKYKGTDNKKNP